MLLIYTLNHPLLKIMLNTNKWTMKTTQYERRLEQKNAFNQITIHKMK